MFSGGIKIKNGPKMGEIKFNPLKAKVAII